MKRQDDHHSPDYSRDVQFISSYLSGNRQVQEILYKQLQQLIGHFMKILKDKGAHFVDKDNTVAEIIFQILLKNDHSVLRAYKGRSKLTTYLWPIVRNRLIDSIRSEKRYRDRMSFEGDLDRKDDPAEEPLTNVQEMIQELFRQESPLAKHVKILKWIEGASYRDIINRTAVEYSLKKKLNSQKIAYILHSNRKKISEKIKKSASGFDK